MARDGDGLAILKKIIAHVPSGSTARERIAKIICRDVDAGVHLGVFVEPYLAAILDGRKTVESRFGIHRCAPFDRVEEGDIILLKRSGGPVVGVALAGGAQSFELDHKLLGEIRHQYAARICAEDDEFWQARAEKRFATLIDLEAVTSIERVAVDKRDRRGWVTYCEARKPCLASPD